MAGTGSKICRLVNMTCGSGPSATRRNRERELILTTQPAATAQFNLQKSVVLWSDISIYQGEVLLPDLPGKRVLLTDGTTPIRDSPCQICHSFQNKMAPLVRDEAGWRNRVEFMRNTIHCCGSSDTAVSDQDEDDLVSYLTLLFRSKLHPAGFAYRRSQIQKHLASHQR